MDDGSRQRTLTCAQDVQGRAFVTTIPSGVHKVGLFGQAKKGRFGVDDISSRARRADPRRRARSRDRDRHRGGEVGKKPPRRRVAGSAEPWTHGASTWFSTQTRTLPTEPPPMAKKQPTAARPEKMKRKEYEKELRKLQAELCMLAGVGEAQGPARDRRVRGARRRGQGRHDQGDHRARQPARVPAGRAARAVGPREDADVHAALHAALPGGRRDRDLRPQLVQPRRRRARDGLLHARSSTERFLELCPEYREVHRRRRHHPASSSGWRSATRSRSGASRRASTTRCGSGSSARWTCRRASAGTTTRARAT